jgi:hypothetical protein
VRDACTDERLDDLNHRVDAGFKEVADEFRALRMEMRTEFAAVRAEAAAMLQVVLGGFGVMLVGFAGTIAAVIVPA